MDARAKPAHDDVLVYGCGSAERHEDCRTASGHDHILTPARRGLIAAPMINAATNIIVRRRRSFAVWADVRVQDLRV
jgi:adenine/guanine phosphoribosyltransferase-like PRPP-binding protein